MPFLPQPYHPAWRVACVPPTKQATFGVIFFINRKATLRPSPPVRIFRKENQRFSGRFVPYYPRTRRHPAISARKAAGRVWRVPRLPDGPANDLHANDLAPPDLIHAACPAKAPKP